MSIAIKSAAYPAGMDLKLREIRRRHYLLAVVRACLLAAAALLAAMVLVMMADWGFTFYEASTRVVLTSAALLAAAATLVWMAWRPIAAVRRLHVAARDADRRIPQLEERWTTVAHFSEADAQRSLDPLSKAMLQQVTSEAVAMGRLVEPAQVARTDGVRRAAAIVGVAALALVGFLVFDWRENFVHVRRFCSPLADISATRLHSQTGDATLPRGEQLDIVVNMSGVPRESATLVLETEGGETDTIELAPTAGQPDTFAYHLPKLEQSLRYRLQAGDGRTPWHSITAIDRPSLADVRFTITSPEYANRPKYEKPYLPERARAIQGSRLTLALRPEAPLARLELHLKRGEETVEETKPEVLTLTAGADGWYRFEAELHQDVSISPLLVSRHALTNEDRRKCAISVIADRAPVAKVISPTTEMAVSPDEVVQIKFEAHDDYGISKAELVLYDTPAEGGGPPRELSVQEIPLGDQQLAMHVAATAQLDLSKLDLGDGKNISYAIRVTDNRLSKPGKPAAKPPADKAASVDEKNEPKAADIAGGGKPGDPAASGEQGDGKAEKTAPTKVATAEPATDTAPSKVAEDKAIAPREAPAAGEQKPAAESPAQVAATLSMQKGADDQNPPPPGTTPEQPAGDKPGSPLLAKGDKPGSPSLAKRDELGSPSLAKSEAPAPAGEQQPKPETASAERPSPRPAPDENAGQMLASAQMAGQHTESNRLRLKITKAPTALAAASAPDRRSFRDQIRDKIKQIDKELEGAEKILQAVVDALDEAPLGDQQTSELASADERLTEVDRRIADLRKETKDTPLAFAGLQMVEVGVSHVTPARDRVFALLRQPETNAVANAAEALHGVGRARELLAELLARYQRVLREQELAKSLEEAVKMYEVYVENMHRLLRRRSQQNASPIERKMAIIEVDQEYLDRLKQVITMRRDLMAEFGRMLADDPRLLGKYMDLIKRRQVSLRNDLAQLHERQTAIAEEVAAWGQADEAQREDIWGLAAELRLQAAAPLARDAAQLAERTEAQFPLNLDTSRGAPAAVVEQSRQIAIRARSLSSRAQRLMRNPLDNVDLAAEVDQFTPLLDELQAALAQLEFQYNDEDTVTFVANRLAETQRLAEQVHAWAESVVHIQDRQYHGLARADQFQLAEQTEQLRLTMLDIDTQLQQQFRDGVPEAVLEIVRTLQQTMESITFNQVAATFALDKTNMAEGQNQQTLALANFELAVELFDQMRRTVAGELDKIDPENSNIADLEDPTLDRLLAQLEREPNLNALLGLGNRPRNLRVLSDWMVWEEQGGTVTDASAEEAIRRARERAKDEMKVAQKKPGTSDKDTDKTDEEWQKVASADEAQKMLEKKIEELRRQAADPKTDAAENEKLMQMAAQLEEMRKHLGGLANQNAKWEEIVRSDQMKAMMRAIANGEPLPDTQWNRIISSLDTGLWQVKRRTPPEEYRQAIEQYQERLRKLMSVEESDAAEE